MVRSGRLLSQPNRDQSRSRKQSKQLYAYGGLLCKP